MDRAVKWLAASQQVVKAVADAAKKKTVNIKAFNFLFQPADCRMSLEYNVRVARELVKQVWTQEQLMPPSFAEIERVYRAMPQFISPSYFRSLSQKEWIRLGIYSIEAYGFFKLGEIIGRRHLVGYKI